MPKKKIRRRETYYKGKASLPKDDAIINANACDSVSVLETTVYSDGSEELILVLHFDGDKKDDG